MTFYRDLAPCDYFGEDCASHLRAVGWLSRWHFYRLGRVPKPVRERLRELLTDCWEPVSFRGVHDCELCWMSRYISHRNLFVPGDNMVYVSPEGLLHYIEAHHYRPPTAYLRALLNCPGMGSDAYLHALCDNGGRAFSLLVRPRATPCPYCGQTLITPRARQCRFCKMDWHDPANPRELGRG